MIICIGSAIGMNIVVHNLKQYCECFADGSNAAETGQWHDACEVGGLSASIEFVDVDGWDFLDVHHDGVQVVVDKSWNGAVGNGTLICFICLRYEIE